MKVFLLSSLICEDTLVILQPSFSASDWLSCCSNIRLRGCTSCITSLMTKSCMLHPSHVIIIYCWINYLNFPVYHWSPSVFHYVPTQWNTSTSTGPQQNGLRDGDCQCSYVQLVHPNKMDTCVRLSMYNFYLLTDKEIRMWLKPNDIQLE